MEAASAPLPELASVSWRSREDARSLRRRGQLWTLFTTAHVVPFLLAAAGLVWLNPLAGPVAFVAVMHAWIIPELYAFRGAGVVRPKGRREQGGERVAQGFLADLLSHEARELQRDTGLAMERGKLGVWLLGEGGALLATADGRVHAFCIRATDAALPPSDRIAHLLLALRTDEEGFATVANHAFAGAAWRLRRRLDPRMRRALDAARSETSIRCLPQPSGAV